MKVTQFTCLADAYEFIRMNNPKEQQHIRITFSDVHGHKYSVTADTLDSLPRQRVEWYDVRAAVEYALGKRDAYYEMNGIKWPAGGMRYLDISVEYLG